MVYYGSNAILVSVSLNPPDNLAKLVHYLHFLAAGEARGVKYLPDIVRWQVANTRVGIQVFLTPESLPIIELGVGGKVGMGRDWTN